MYIYIFSHFPNYRRFISERNCLTRENERSNTYIDIESEKNVFNR